MNSNKKLVFQPALTPPHSSVRIWLALVAMTMASLFSGCASGELAKNTTVQPKPGKAMAVVYRTPGMAGAGTKLYLYANDQLVGGMGRAAFYSVETPPGPLNLSFSYRAEKNSAGKWAGIAVTTGGVGLLTDAIIQPGAMRKRGDVTLNLQPNEVHYVRIDGFKLTPMSTEAGREEMKDCHWINGPH